MRLTGVFAMPDTRNHWNWNTVVEFVDFEAGWKRDWLHLSSGETSPLGAMLR